MRLLRLVSLPRLAIVALAVVAAAPSAQAWTTYRACTGELTNYDMGLCNYHVDLTVEVDPASGSARAGLAVCGEEEPVWKAQADPGGDGGTVWIPMSPPDDDGPSRRESYGSHCDGGEAESPPPIGIHQSVHV